MKYNRPIAVSIAGFDPTGGAGVLADVKTFEQFQVLGMGVLSATTIQTETEFLEVNWLSAGDIISQLEPLVANYKIAVVKIGIILSLADLGAVLTWLQVKIPGCKVVWDPVLAASSGFDFHPEIDQEVLINVLKQVYLITPNIPEARKLTGISDEIEAAFQLGEHTNVLLKGGHSSVREGLDVLIQDKKPVEIPIQLKEKMSAKHGSGCILSSAIAANLALGVNLHEACEKGKIYTEKRLASNSNLLAYHVA